MNTFRIMLLGTVAAGLTAAAVAPASAGEVEKSLKLAGQVSRVLVVADDGVSSDVYGVDNDNSSSRLKFTGMAKGEDLTAKGYVEFNVVGEENTGQDTNGKTLAMRQSYVSLQNDMGTLSLGYTTSAGHGATTNSFSGVGNGSTWGDPVFGGLTFRAEGVTLATESSADSSVSTALQVGDVDDYFTTGRENVVKYSSPKFNGFQAFVSADAAGADGVGADVAAQLKYSADYDGTKIKAAIVGVNSGASNTTWNDMIAGSVAVELANGLNAMIGGGKRSANASGRNDNDGWTAQIGYDASMVDAGETSFMIMYEEQNDKQSNGSNYETVALNIQQSLKD
ncbi:MAG: porin, partial [Alphaproteobacteria bacterium]